MKISPDRVYDTMVAACVLGVPHYDLSALADIGYIARAGPKRFKGEDILRAKERLSTSLSMKAVMDEAHERYGISNTRMYHFIGENSKLVKKYWTDLLAGHKTTQHIYRLPRDQLEGFLGELVAFFEPRVRQYKLRTAGEQLHGLYERLMRRVNRDLEPVAAGQVRLATYRAGVGEAIRAAEALGDSDFDVVNERNELERIVEEVEVDPLRPPKPRRQWTPLARRDDAEEKEDGGEQDDNDE